VTATAYVRYRVGEPSESPVLFMPPGRDHPAFGELCPECGEEIDGDEPVRLRARVRVMEMDHEDVWKYKAGRWINVPADILHDACARTRATVESGRTVTVVRKDMS
jgi:hypothetical protein